MLNQASKRSSLEQSQDIVITNDIYEPKAQPGRNECPGDQGFLGLKGTGSLISSAEKNFDKIDSNKDGVMSADELNAAADDCAYEHYDRLMMGILNEYMEKFQSLAAGESSEGISKEDIKEFSAMLEEKNEALRLLLSTKSNVDVIEALADDGAISQEELNQAITDSSDDYQKARLEKMLSIYDQLQSLDGYDGISNEDLWAYFDYAALGSEDSAFVQKLQDIMTQE